MPILFLGTEDLLHEQDILLMQALSSQPENILYSCPQNANTALLANSLQIPYWEQPSSSIERFISLGRIIKEQNIKYVHILDAKALTLAKKIKFYYKQEFKILATHHSDVDLEMKRRALCSSSYAINGLFSQKIFRLMASSHALLDNLEQFETIKHRIKYLPYTVSDLAKHGANQFLKKPKPNEQFIFLMDISSVKQCGLHILSRALELIKTELQSLNFEIRVCTHNLEIEELIRELEASEQLDFFAFFNNWDTKLFYTSSHAMLCPATGNEGNYKSIIRSWNYDLPIISSDLPAHTKILLSGQQNQAALIYPKDSAEVLAKYMIELIKDEKLRQDLVLTGKTMLNQYSMEILREKYYANLEY